jgi:hypothetical protein
MLSEAEVLKAIGHAIEDPTFNINSNTDNSENWDSLGVLSIITTLAKLTSGESEKIPDLVSISSAAELIKVLRENHLVA